MSHRRRGLRSSVQLALTWVEWDLSNLTRASACSASSSTHGCSSLPRKTLLLFLIRMCLRRLQAAASRHSRIEGRRHVPRRPRRRYGWEKLFSERMCRHFREDFGLETRAAHYHNVYGPHGTFDGGREKAPAAICRKVIAAKLSGHHEIEIWGDGEQTRSASRGCARLAGCHCARSSSNLASRRLRATRKCQSALKSGRIAVTGAYRSGCNALALSAPRSVRGCRRFHPEECPAIPTLRC